MEDAIASQQKDSKAEEVEELYLDNVRSTKLSGLTESYTTLMKLSIVNCGLVSLEGLPRLPSLEQLHLSDNKLSGGLEVLTSCLDLKKVELAGNKIANLEDLVPLSKLSKLKSLDLFNCPVTKLDGYRDQVFELLPSLNSLDGLNKYGEEVDDSDGEESDGNEDGDEDDSDGEPGLDYLNRDLGSGSSDNEEDYDPDADEGLPDDDLVDPSDEGDAEDDDAGPSQCKKPRLDDKATQEEDDKATQEEDDKATQEEESGSDSDSV